jgi:hypothetical protein
MKRFNFCESNTGYWGLDWEVRDRNKNTAHNRNDLGDWICQCHDKKSAEMITEALNMLKSLEVPE